MTSKSLKILTTIIITVILVSTLLSQIQIADVITTLVSIDPLYLIVGFVLYICSYFLRALRFHILLNGEVGIWDLFNIVCVHNMVNSILPARTGELSYIYLLKKLHNKNTGEGIATLFVVRVFDFISISSLFFISILMMHNLPEIIMKAVWVIAGFMILIVIFSITLLYSGESFLNIVRRFFRKFNLDKKYFADYLLRKGKEVVENFKKIKNNGKIIEIAIVSIAIWLSAYSLAYMLLTGMKIPLNFFQVLLASTFSLFTTVLPIQGIGGFGTYEGGWTIGFIAMGLTKEVAISSGFAYHIIIIAYFVILGLIATVYIKVK